MKKSKKDNQKSQEPRTKKLDDEEEHKVKNEYERKTEKTDKYAIELEKLIDYKYNEKGQLVNKKTGKKCERLGKQDYELVGMYVQQYLENFLIQNFNLTTLFVPNLINDDFIKRDESQAQCKILTTKDFQKNPKCLLLIQGTGAVRLGQWARSVCINENIYLGSMIPYVNKAIKNNFSVVIFNPNERYDFFNDKKKIEIFDSMENHCIYVYNNIIKANKNIKEIYIVAHSMGGECTVQILLYNLDDLINGKIKKIAFTDSVHDESYKYLKKIGIEQFRKISRNYIRSQYPVGTFIRKYSSSIGGVDCYSSWHIKHEYTSGTAIDEIFKYFNCGK